MVHVEGNFYFKSEEISDKYLKEAVRTNELTQIPEITEALLSEILLLKFEVAVVGTTDGRYFLHVSESGTVFDPMYVFKELGDTLDFFLHNHPDIEDVSQARNPRTGLNDVLSLSDWLVDFKHTKKVALVFSNQDATVGGGLILDMSGTVVLDFPEKSEDTFSGLLENYIDIVIKRDGIVLENKPYQERVYYVVREFNAYLSTLDDITKYRYIEDILYFAQERGVVIEEFPFQQMGLDPFRKKLLLPN